MKKLAIILVIILSSCTYNSTLPGKVTSIKSSNNDTKKYIVTLEYTNGMVEYYTDSLYKVGDIIK